MTGIDRFFGTRDIARLPRRSIFEAATPGEAYSRSIMPLQIEAVYENGVLKPLRPLALSEHQHVMVIISEAKSTTGRPNRDTAYLEDVRMELAAAEPAAGLEEVRRRLSKVPGSMTGDFIAEREER